MVKKKFLPKETKSRAKYKCPTKLGEMLRQVRLIPPDFQMKLFELVFDEQRLLLREQTGDNHAAPSITEVLNACLEDTPEEFQQHIEYETLQRTKPFGIAKQHMFNVYNIQTKSNVYSEYYDMRMSMLRLVQRLEMEHQHALLDWDASPLSISTVLKRNDSGKLHITGLAVLIGKFDDSRLRRCVICQRIFWAKRENSKTCSPRCLNVLNVRNSRSLSEEEKAERKAKRDANRELIKNGMAKTKKRSK